MRSNEFYNSYSFRLWNSLIDFITTITYKLLLVFQYIILKL